MRANTISWRPCLSLCLCPLFALASHCAGQSQGTEKSQGGREPPIVDASPLIQMLRPNVTRAGEASLAGSDTLGLLNLESVRQELRLKPSQVRSLEEIMAEQQEELAKLVKALRSTEARTDPRQVKEIFATVAELRAFVHETVEKEILSPSQRKRLNQIALQVEIEKRGMLSTLLSAEVSAELELTKEEQEDLSKANSQIQSQLERDIRQLKMEAKAKLVSKLMLKQRRKLNELLGRPFDPEDSE